MARRPNMPWPDSDYTSANDDGSLRTGQKSMTDGAGHKSGNPDRDDYGYKKPARGPQGDKTPSGTWEGPYSDGVPSGEFSVKSKWDPLAGDLCKGPILSKDFDQPPSQVRYAGGANVRGYNKDVAQFIDAGKRGPSRKGY